MTVDKGANCHGKRVRALQLPGRRAADLGRARRQGRDPGRGDPARDRRPGARDPRARQGGRAPARALLSDPLSPDSGASYRVTGASPGHPSRPGVGRHAGGRDLDRLGADARVRRPHRSRRAACCRPASRRLRGRSRCALGLGDGLPLARPRAAQATCVDARRRARDRVGGRASREGPRLRRGDGPPRAARRAPARAPSLRRAGRSGDARAAAAGRGGARRSRCRSSSSASYDSDVYSQPHRGGARPARRRARLPRALAVAAAAGRAARRAARSASALPSSCRSTAPTASRTSRCAATRATSSRRAAGRFSPTAWSAARRSSPATRSATQPSAASSSREFVRVAHAKGWRVAVAGAANEALEDYASLGFKSMYLGDEAVIRPATFSLDGRAIRKVRQSVSRLEKSGYRVEVLSTADADEALRAQVRAVSEEWRGNWPERGFTMAMDALFLYPDTVLAVAVAPDGRVGGFLQLVPVAGQRGLLARVDAPPRRHAERVDGVPDHGDGRVGAAARRHRAVAQLRGLRRLPAARATTRRVSTRSLRWVLLKGDRLFQLERLHSFNRKFFPRLAAALLLLRAVGRPAARRARVPARRVAAHATRPVGSLPRSGGAMRIALAGGLRHCSCSRRAPRTERRSSRRARRAFQRSGLRDAGAGRARAISTSSSRRAHPRALGREDPVDAVSRHPLAGAERRRAGPAVGGVRPGVPEVASLLRRLHRPQRRHARRRVPVERNARDPVVGEAAPLREGLRAEPQRRPAAVRPGRPPVLGERRRRRRRRSAAATARASRGRSRRSCG